MTAPGQIVILNGAPRSGKSSIVAAIQETFDDPWMNLGVDIFCRQVTPPRYQPGIGLRPGGERPDLERFIPVFYAGLYEAVASHSRLGLNVVVDVGHHDDYTRPLHTLRDAAQRLEGLPAFLVGVRCPLAVIMQRRRNEEPGQAGGVAGGATGSPIPDPVLRWQDEVHMPGIYDFEVDTSELTPAQCAAAIRRRLLEGPPPAALARLAEET